jgi:5-methylcytosine-specific restriction endonuclease McrA
MVERIASHRPARAQAEREHYEQRKQLRPELVEFYGSAEWRELSLQYRARHPFCVQCDQQSRTTLVDLVDHVIEIEDGGAKLDPANLQSLCFACHAVKTQAAAVARGGAGSIAGAFSSPSVRPRLRASSGNSEGGGFRDPEGLA